MTTTKITDQSLEAVKALAEAATAGRWNVSHGGDVFSAEDAAFIAATDPQFILDLIADRNYWKREAAYNLRMAEEQHAQAAQG